jgi:bile acid-coenzyme A ligase
VATDSFGRRLTVLAEARGTGDVAVVFAATGGRESVITWHVLEARANQFARHLLDRGIDVDSLVAVALPNSLEHHIACFGAWKAGASVVPLRHDLPAWERDRLLELADPAVVVANWEDGPPGTIGTAEMATTTDLDSRAVPDRVPRWSRVIPSSGSTGRPKLIVTPTPGLIEEQGTLNPIAGDAGPKVQLGASPIYHANGWHGGGPAAVLDGGLTILMERFDASQAVDLIERHRITTAFLAPIMLMRIARLAGAAERDFSSLTRIVCGGSTIPQWVVRFWLDRIPPECFTIIYGSSEAIGATHVTGDQWLLRPGTCGQPQESDLLILDEDLRPVPPGTVGTIYQRPHEAGPTFAYLGAAMPEPTAEDYRTVGDMGWVDEDGYLYIADRRQDLIITGGANVYPAEVEAALSEHPAVADQAVIGLADDEWGHRVHAIIELEKTADPVTPEELRTFCRGRLAAYKVPKSVEIVDQLPRSEVGKISRTALIEARTRPLADA